MQISLRILSIFIVLITIDKRSLSQDKYFEGTVIYVTREFDKDGHQIQSPITKEKIFFSKSTIVTQFIQGAALSLYGNKQIYMNSEKRVRYRIDNDSKLIKKVGIVEIEKIEPLEEKSTDEELIQGYKCDVHILQYVHRFESPNGITFDTLSCTYFNSKTLKMFQPEVFGFLQGNKNSLFLDGRYDCIPLKVILKRRDGSKIVIESELIEQMNVDALLKLPEYPIMK